MLDNQYINNSQPLNPQLGYRQLLISDETTVSEIQNAFSNFYPYLAVEFINPGSFMGKPRHIQSNSPVKKIRHLSEPVLLNFAGSRTIAELAKDFKEKVGVMAIVYRKSGKVWNEISFTDNWTLESQNTAGHFISTEIGMDEESNRVA